MYRRLFIIISFILVGLGLYFFSVAISRYQVRTSTQATGVTREISFSTAGDLRDAFMIEIGSTLQSIENTTAVDAIIEVFGGSSSFVQLVEAQPAVIENSNFGRLDTAGLFFLFSSDSYEKLTALAQAFYARYPQKKALFELTNHSAVDKVKTQTFATAFPNSKFYASNFTNWNRERARQIIGNGSPSASAECQSYSNPGALTYPQIDGLSYHIDLLARGTDPAEDIAIFWDEMFDASRDIPGTSIKVCWPDTRANLLINEIKFTPGLNRSETSFFGVLLDSYFNYATARGDETRASTAVPVRYVGVGDITKFSGNSRTIIKVFTQIAKDKMKIVFPSSGAGMNLRDAKPFYTIVGYKPDIGLRGVIVNADSNKANFKANIEPATTILSTYKITSNERGQTLNFSTDNRLEINPFEVIAFSADNIAQIVATPAPATTVAPANTPTNTPAQPGNNTPNPTNTIAPTSTQTPAPTSTPTSSPTPTPSPTPTLTPTPTSTNTPTPTNTPSPGIIVTQPTSLAVDGQRPGFNPIYMIILPIGVAILGLML